MVDTNESGSHMTMDSVTMIIYEVNKMYGMWGGVGDPQFTVILDKSYEGYPRLRDDGRVETDFGSFPFVWGERLGVLIE